MTASYTGINISQPFFRDAHLVGASLIFDTKGKDKDHDTALTVRVVNAERIVVAERIDITGHWINKTSYLVSLDLKNSPTKDEMCAGGVLLEIHPNGNDSWEFAYKLWMFYSDQTATEKSWDGKLLTQDNPSTLDGWHKE